LLTFFVGFKFLLVPVNFDLRSPITICLCFFVFYIRVLSISMLLFSVSFKTVLVVFSSCARLN